MVVDEQMVKMNSLFQKISAAAGCVWILGKIAYAFGYYSDGMYIWYI